MRGRERRQIANRSTPLLLSVAFALGCGQRPAPQCGVASLVAVLAREGRPVAYRTLLAHTHVVDGHTTFTDLAQTARGEGLTMRGYRLTSSAVLRPDDVGVIELVADHFVALVGRRGDRLEIVDSPDGKAREPQPWSAARLESEWTGNVLLVESNRHG